MTTLNSHKGTNMRWDAYKLGGNPVTFDFSSEETDILTSRTFVLNISRIGSAENIIQLTESEEITKSIAAKTISVNLTKAIIDASLPGADYWWELAYTEGGAIGAMFQGPLALHNKANPGSPNTITPTVNLGGTTVSVTVTLGGGAFDISQFDPSQLTNQQKIDLVSVLIDQIRSTINDEDVSGTVFDYDLDFSIQ